MKMKAKTSKAVGLCATTTAVLFLAGSETKSAEPNNSTGKPATTQEKQEPVEWGQEVEGFRLSLKPNKKEYLLGEAVSLNVVFKNLSRENTWVVSPGGVTLTYKLEIIRPDGTAAPLTPEGERIQRNTRRFFMRNPGSLSQPGRKSEFALHGATLYFDMTQIGEYQLRVSRPVPLVDDPLKEVALTSNTVTITIREETAKEKREKLRQEKAKQREERRK